ncbi:AI-2E family transporter [Lacrimispora sp. 210928-DFI.3.58]|uniref:AI-2E family transporter n=1 Tax=Lacrimispora sp. 210928-DFI.3.58 TaxID=2883214 RepID=UPI001D06445C|nr:AI-2E family transporter [Lacrimispora sp. 210928-DFI.3.58]MCB7320629.1 AI-2E family transporter [Lacrimispora sp. 210928-DFI.3.58]
MELNSETMKKLRGLILFTVAVVVAGINYRVLLGLLADLLHIASPFLLGAAIAFVLNVPMRNIESHMVTWKKGKRLKRPLSLALTILLVSGALFLVVFVVAPQLLRTFLSLQKSIPLFFAGLQKEAEHMFANTPELVEYISRLEIDWPKLLGDFAEFLKNGAGSMLNSAFSATASLVSGVSNFAIGFIFAIYILLQKETLSRQAGNVLKAFLPEGEVERVQRIAQLTERTFSSFLTGQCMEAVILGAMFLVTMSVLRLPYALLIGVLIAFTALIPIFGAFIGLGVGVFLMLMESPVDALVFTIVFFVLQQIEGNLIYPHVVGGSVGLPSIWVLVAVTVGGSMMGIVGMLVFIPLCSVLYSLLKGEVRARLREKEKAEPMP